MNARPKNVIVFMFLITLLTVSACAPSATPSSPISAPGAPMEPSRGDSGGVTTDSYTKGEIAPNAYNPAQPQSGAADERIVIRNASLGIVVDDPSRTLDAITRMAEAMNGFVVNSNLYKNNNRDVEIPEAKITIRVPADQLNDALEQIKAQVKDRAKDVLNETVSGQDVTKEYTDLNSRLKNLEETEAQLREIMGSATRTEDVLQVYQQLTQIREQIEVTKGQIQYYKESAAMSAIDVLIRAQASVQPLEIGGWQPAGIARDAIQSLINTMQFLGEAGIWVVLYILPVALAIFLPLRLLWWLLRRGRKNKVNLPPSTPPVVPPAV